MAKEFIVSENAQTHAVESVPGIPDALQKMSSDVMNVSGQMIVLTWVAFLVAAICLHKLLWKPILKAVGDREKSVSDALDGAAQARQEMATSEVRKQQLLQQAENEARDVAEQASRKADAIVAKADGDAQAVAARRFQDAERAIAQEYRRSFEALRLDAANRLTGMLEQMLRQKLTEEQKVAYQADLLNEVKL